MEQYQCGRYPEPIDALLPVTTVAFLARTGSQDLPSFSNSRCENARANQHAELRNYSAQLGGSFFKFGKRTGRRPNASISAFPISSKD